MRVAWAVLAVLAAASCADVLDIDGIEIGSGNDGGTTSNGGGGTGAGAGGTSDGGSTSNGGGMAGTEDCTNGVDDNDDGLVDCEDAECVAYQCAPNVPDGWNGPYVSHTAATAAACPSDAPNEILEAGSGSLTAPVATCSACGCGDPTNVVCTAGRVSHWDQPDCDGLDGTFTPPQIGVCADYNMPPTVSAVRGANNVAFVSGECTPSGGAPTIAPAQFDSRVRLCASDDAGAGCGADAQCIPIPDAPYSDKPCISRTGDLACPAGDYADKTLVYTGITDDRGCEACGCGDANGVSCNGASTVYEGSGCTGGNITIPHDASCHDVGPTESVIFNIAPSGGSCPTQGGEPSGNATPTGETTICCVL